MPGMLGIAHQRANFTKQRVKSSPRQWARILLRKTRRIIC